MLAKCAAWPPLVKERFGRPLARPDLPWNGIAGEIDLGTHAALLVLEGRHRGMTETVFIFALAHHQVELQQRLIVANAQRGETASPTQQRIVELHVGIQFLDGVTLGVEAEIPRLQRLFAVLLPDAVDVNPLRVAGAALQIVQQFEEPVLAEAFGSGDLVIVIVLVAQHARQLVALLDDVQKTVLDDVGFDALQAPKRGFALRFAVRSSDLERQLHRTGGLELAALLVRIAQIHLPARQLQLALHLDDFGRQSLRLRLLDNVRLEEADPALQGFGLLFIRRPAFEQAPTEPQPFNIPLEGVQFPFGLVEGVVIRTDPHFGGPEQFFFGGMQRDVLAVQGDDRLRDFG